MRKICSFLVPAFERPEPFMGETATDMWDLTDLRSGMHSPNPKSMRNEAGHSAAQPELLPDTLLAFAKIHLQSQTNLSRGPFSDVSEATNFQVGLL
jgi:hypothetical protein